jgi:hypothetical protein
MNASRIEEIRKDVECGNFANRTDVLELLEALDEAKKEIPGLNGVIEDLQQRLEKAKRLEHREAGLSLKRSKLIKQANQRMGVWETALRWIIVNVPFDEPNGGDIYWYAEQCFFRAKKALERES